MVKIHKNTLRPKLQTSGKKIGTFDLFVSRLGAGAAACFKSKLRITDQAVLAGTALGLLIAGISVVIFDPTTALVSCLLGWTMLAIAITDARRFIIPDILSLPAIPAGLLYSGLSTTLRDPDAVILEHMLSAVLAAAFFHAITWGYRLLRKREGLGLGDVKLAAVAGAWTGMEGISLVILGASIAAIFYAFLLHIAQDRHVTVSTMIPFGTFLAPAIWLAWSLLRLSGP